MDDNNSSSSDIYSSGSDSYSSAIDESADGQRTPTSSEGGRRLSAATSSGSRAPCAALRQDYCVNDRSPSNIDFDLLSQRLEEALLAVNDIASNLRLIRSSVRHSTMGEEQPACAHANAKDSGRGRTSSEHQRGRHTDTLWGGHSRRRFSASVVGKHTKGKDGTRGLT